MLPLAISLTQCSWRLVLFVPELEKSRNNGTRHTREDPGGGFFGVDVIIQILQDKRDDMEMMKLKANVVGELLNWSENGPVKQVKLEQASISTHLTAELIEEIKQRAKEIASQSGFLDV